LAPFAFFDICYFI